MGLFVRHLFCFRATPRSTDFCFVPTTAGAGRDRHIDQGTEHRAGPCSSKRWCAAPRAEHPGCRVAYVCLDATTHASSMSMRVARSFPSSGHVADLASSPRSTQDCTRGRAPVLQCTAGFYHHLYSSNSTDAVQHGPCLLSPVYGWSNSKLRSADDSELYRVQIKPKYRFPYFY